ncbi:oxidative stress-responsive serine-rich protein 1 [Topomyia yanbarensis]|uniref:oxidative stress-responsive serine-rich protein 1 n=1 Tax=Topomyia yanbarensis TaxID=2498891 RepID=UPI00273A90FA|nr:oxidative stress-responsive serine-rich protein 1 [Topomyia yanbarensis]XP_058834062.1 oxidative stress-responsive serine-rich protein 1 [Topomyia yanbarensis]
MSSESEEQDFDGTLNILQMLTALSPEVAPLPVSNVNPFQIKSSAMENLSKSEAAVKQIFGARCECGAERIFTAPNQSNSPSGKGFPIGGKHGSLEHGIINPTPFKHKVKVEKKGIVRESMLKNIGKCVHQNIVKQSSIAKEIQQHHLSSTISAVSTLKPSLSENNLTKCFNNDSSNDILDFRLLVDQCSELTISSPAGGKTQDSPNFSQTSFRSLRQPDFSVFQNNRTVLSRRNRRARQLKRSNSTSSLESDSSSNSSAPFSGSIGAGFSGIIGPATSSGSQQGQSSNQQQQSHSQSSSPSSSSSASCSTQARLNSTMPCDITIDEMASYFETLVHIPKKMSSMAEMMYI